MLCYYVNNNTHHTSHLLFIYLTMQNIVIKWNNLCCLWEHVTQSVALSSQERSRTNFNALRRRSVSIRLINAHANAACGDGNVICSMLPGIPECRKPNVHARSHNAEYMQASKQKKLARAVHKKPVGERSCRQMAKHNLFSQAFARLWLRRHVHVPEKIRYDALQHRWRSKKS